MVLTLTFAPHSAFDKPALSDRNFSQKLRCIEICDDCVNSGRIACFLLLATSFGMAMEGRTQEVYSLNP